MGAMSWALSPSEVTQPRWWSHSKTCCPGRWSPPQGDTFQVMEPTPRCHALGDREHPKMP